MTYKHALTINKAWFSAGASGFSPAGLIARIKNALKLEVPTGYQDQSGFHFGVKAAEKTINWPATW